MRHLRGDLAHAHAQIRPDQADAFVLLVLRRPGRLETAAESQLDGELNASRAGNGERLPRRLR